jgi:peptidoglycan/xylan/chitin deacetylase (PgdA/CDA1 family)
VHIVAAGETLPAIADRYGTTVTALVEANGIRGSRLEAGRELVIPDGAAPPPATAWQAYAAATTISQGAGTRRSVALTFDAGADRGYAELILDVLKERGVRATFGMTGLWAQQNPDLVQRMAREGHQLINHSWDHSSFTGLSTRTRGLSREQRWAQLDRTEALLVELTGRSTRPFFRSPYGDVDASVQRDIGARGYAYNVLWTVDSTGWTGAPVRSIIDRCLRGARPGAIYVMHVGAAAQDGPALAAIIDGLAAAGYDFETIDEIIVG